MKQTVFVLLLCCLSFCAISQKKLVFTDTVHHKVITAQTNDKLKLLYRGYLGQLEADYGTVDYINDSVVRFNNHRTIRINDIVGFRKFSKYRNVLQTTTRILTFAGSLVAINAIYKNNPGITFGQGVGVSLGVGAVNYTINALLFPDRIKNYLYNGWTVKVE